jgi:hypothetical protein
MPWPALALRDGDDLFLGVLVAEAVALARVDLAQVDIQPHHVAALARDEQGVALVGRLDRRLEPDVRKVGNGQHVHHAPGMVGEVALRQCADGLAHADARAVAADHVARAQRLRLAAGGIAQRHHHRVLAFGFDAQRHEFQAVVRLQPRRRLAHVVQQVLLQARLVDDDMRHLRLAVFDVLHAAGAHDARARPVPAARTPSR